MQPISAHYRTNIFHVLLVALIIFGLSAAVLVATHRQVLEAEPADLIWTIYMFLALAFGIGISTLLMMRDRERMHWSLSEHELVGGMKRPIRIPISNIVSISEGVPARTKRAANNPWLKSGIVLKIKDNRILSLNLATTEDGAQIMGTLIKRCSAVLTADPSYTAIELTILHRLKWNRVIDTTSGRPV
jgi:hypothetical protein